MKTVTCSSSPSAICLHVALCACFFVILFVTATNLGPGYEARSATSIALPGAVCTWDGSTGDWADVSKWSCGGVPGPGDTAIITNGTVTVSSSATVGSLQLSGGTLRCNAGLTVDTSMSWIGGTIDGSGVGTLSSNGTLNIDGANTKILNGGSLINNGTINWLDGALFLLSAFQNRAGATLDIKTDRPFNGAGGVDNSGIITKSVGSTTAQQFNQFVLNNSGTVNIDVGIADWTGSTTNSSGPYNVASGATLRFSSSGGHTINPGGSINGAGTLDFAFSGTFNFNGVFNITGSVSLASATVNFNTTTNISVLNLSSATLSGSGAVTILSAMNWTGGTIAGSGAFAIAASATADATGTDFKTLSGRRLTNNGRVNYLGAHLFFIAGCVFDNRAGATLDIKTDNALTGDDGRIENAGSLVKTGGGSALITPQLDNSGRLEISSSSLFFEDQFSALRTINQTGGITMLNDGILGANLAVNGGMLAGTGTVTGNVANSAIISPGIVAASPGTITINGSYTQTATGRLDIELAGTDPGVTSDLLVANTAASTSTNLAGILNVTLLNGFRPAVDATFQVMRYGARSGAFNTINGLDLGGGQLLSPDYRTSELVLLSGDGGPAVPWVQVMVIPPEVRPSLVPPRATSAASAANTFPFRYDVIVGNSGGRRAPVIVVVELPPAQPGVPVPHDMIEDLISNDPLVPIDNPEDRSLFNQLSKRVVKPDGTVLIPFAVVLPPQSSFIFHGGFGIPIGTSAGTALQLKSKFRPQAATGCPNSPEPKVKAFGNTMSPSNDCIAGILNALLGFLPGGDCFNIVKNLLLQEGVAAGTGTQLSLASMIASALLDAAKCASSLLPAAAALKAALEIVDLISKLNDVNGIFDACSGSVLPNPLLPEFQSEDETQCVTSADPNDKVGAKGAGASRFITNTEALRYAVFFENLPEATAPAQVVSIFDQLDPTLLNFNTFSLGAISFADKLVTPPPNSSSFTTDVDLRPEKNLIVRINAGLNKGTGLLTWLFTSIDPASGQPLPPTSPDGFLDPDVTPPEGQGAVLFFVGPKSGLPTGTVIRNKATIVFDQNQPMNTPEWFNTLDNVKPTSQVLPLSSSQCSSFRVEWSGSDATSGIAHYSIFVSKNGEPFEPWVLHTTQTSEFFNGVPGNTYSFYSVARDGAGNVEDPPAQPDASATINTAMAINPTTESFTAQGATGSVQVLSPGGCNWIAVSRSFFVRVTAGTSGAGGGSVTYSVDANPTDETRDGAIMIAGQRFLIHQAAGPATANQAPDAVDDNATTNPGTPVTIVVLANDSDPDGDALTISNLSPANHGTLALNANNTVTYSPNAGFAGTDSFTYTISDGRGGSDAATVRVTVSQSNRPPNSVCQNITRAADAHCQATVTAQEVGGGSSDPDGDAVTLALTPSGPFAVGSHSVTLTVTDSHGASSTCAATITVIDNTPPVINCPTNIFTAAPAGQCATAVTYSATATDNCGGATLSCIPPSGSTFKVGTTNVSCVATDGSNNATSCSFSVTVNDTQPPSISCPPNLSVTAGTGATSSVVNYTQPLGSDNCSATTTVCAPPSGSSFPVGVTTVICTVTDASGNSAQCSFTVTVSAGSAPADRIAFESNRDGNFEIYTMTADGTNSTRLTFKARSDTSPAWSPDRTKIAFTSERDGNSEIYMMNADGSNQTRLTFTSAVEGDPSWSPDGAKIAFWSTRDGNPEIYVMDANGANQTRITSNSRSDTQPQWSPDSKKLVFVSNRDSLINFDIYVMNANGSNVTRLTTNLSVDESPDWSPDGTKIVFTSDRSNLFDFEIWVMNVNGTNQTRLTTNTRSSVRPTWSRDGTKITFATNRDSLLNFEIYTMNANGSSPTRITTNSAIDFNPDR